MTDFLIPFSDDLVLLRADDPDVLRDLSDELSTARIPHNLTTTRIRVGRGRSAYDTHGSIFVAEADHGTALDVDSGLLGST